MDQENGSGEDGDAREPQFIQLPEDAEVPENVQELLVGIPLVGNPEDPSVSAMLEGRCPGCGQPLGATTTVVLDPEEILGVTCSGICLVDLQVIAFLQEAVEDIRSAMNFRGGTGDEVS